HQAADLQRSPVAASHEPSHPPARAALSRGGARWPGESLSGVEGYGDHPRGLDRGPGGRSVEPGYVDAALSHWRARRIGDDGAPSRKRELREWRDAVTRTEDRRRHGESAWD